MLLYYQMVTGGGMGRGKKNLSSNLKLLRLALGGWQGGSLGDARWCV